MDLSNFHALIGSASDSSGITWWQMSIRACLIFLYGVILVRLGGRRVFWRSDSSDIIVSVLVGSNLSRALTGTVPFLPTLAATGVLVLIYWALDYAAFYSSSVGWLAKGHAQQLIRNGRINWRNMRHNGVTEGDLREAMRMKGIKDVRQIQHAYMERNGSVSFIQRDG
jgi:uncharacterized membrane protein YcaP (DUF421 family)